MILWVVSPLTFRVTVSTKLFFFFFFCIVLIWFQITFNYYKSQVYFMFFNLYMIILLSTGLHDWKIKYLVSCIMHFIWIIVNNLELCCDAGGFLLGTIFHISCKINMTGICRCQDKNKLSSKTIFCVTFNFIIYYNK